MQSSCRELLYMTITKSMSVKTTIYSEQSIRLQPSEN